MLTDNQVDVIVQGIRERYSKPDALAGSAPPPYAVAEPGDAMEIATLIQVRRGVHHFEDGSSDKIPIIG